MAEAPLARPSPQPSPGGRGGNSDAFYPPRGMILAEVWIGLIIGIVLMLYTRPFGSYLFSLVTRQPFHTGVNWTDGPNAGQEVPYTQLEGGTFYSDSSIFLFGLALVLGALAQALQLTRLPGRRAAAWFSLVCVLLATLYNVVAVVVLLQANITPLMSLLCVGIGGYIIYYEWSTMQAYGRATE